MVRAAGDGTYNLRYGIDFFDDVLHMIESIEDILARNSHWNNRKHHPVVNAGRLAGRSFSISHFDPTLTLSLKDLGLKMNHYIRPESCMNAALLPADHALVI